MRKIIASVLALLLVVAMPVSALMEESYTASVIAATETAVLAPFGGQVDDFDLRVGDALLQGDTLLSLSTTKVYAPASGTVNALNARMGDNSQYVSARYGALLTIQPEYKYTIAATTSGAYNKDKNKYIYGGEHVYLVSSDDKSRTGEGVITSVSGSSYTVELLKNNLELNETVNIYREAGHDAESRIGKGKTARITPLEITADGSILRIHVAEGEQVSRGQLLLEMVSGSLDAFEAVEPTIKAPFAGAVSAINVVAGQTVSKDDVLATLVPLTALTVEMLIPEDDVLAMEAGRSVSIEFDALGQERVQGTIESIAMLPDANGDYPAYVEFAATEGIRIGMSATVYVE